METMRDKNSKVSNKFPSLFMALTNIRTHAGEKMGHITNTELVSSNETDTRFIRYFVPGCFSRCICINYFV